MSIPLIVDAEDREPNGVWIDDIDNNIIYCGRSFVDFLLDVDPDVQMLETYYNGQCRILVPKWLSQAILMYHRNNIEAFSMRDFIKRIKL